MRTPIRAVDECLVAAPVSAVWPVLADVEGYAEWWPKSLGLRVISGGSAGAEVEINPRGGRPFRCRVVALQPPDSLTMEYLGFVQGTGTWRLAPASDGTRVIYDLDTHADGWIVRVLACFVDLGGIHSSQMREVLDALKRRVQEKK